MCMPTLVIYHQVFPPVYDYGDPQQQLKGTQRSAVWRFHQRLGYILELWISTTVWLKEREQVQQIKYQTSSVSHHSGDSPHEYQGFDYLTLCVLASVCLLKSLTHGLSLMRFSLRFRTPCSRLSSTTAIDC